MNGTHVISNSRGLLQTSCRLRSTTVGFKFDELVLSAWGKPQEPVKRGFFRGVSVLWVSWSNFFSFWQRAAFYFALFRWYLISNMVLLGQSLPLKSGNSFARTLVETGGPDRPYVPSYVDAKVIMSGSSLAAWPSGAEELACCTTQETGR